MGDERDEIRSRIDLVSLVQREVPLKKRGRTWSGLCPFHEDRNPSFTVSSETGRYRCWSCGEAGDCFTWVMKRRNVDFPEALRILAAEVGVELKVRNPEAAQRRQSQTEIMEEALRFFRDEYARSGTAREYTAGRDLDSATMQTWEIGFAPDGDHLAQRLKRNGISLTQARELFLVDQDSGGGYFDKFRSRLMFPIRDERGTLVAFGGRIIGPGQPKYINSSDTPLYRKSRVLYGFRNARDRISQTRTAVLTEGYLDTIACHRADVTNAVASLGTALSEDHAKLLAKWCDTVTIFYDADEPGQKAAERAIDVLQAENLRVRIALMPAGEDPDSLLRKSGAAGVQSAIANDLTPLDFRILRLERTLNPGQDEYWSQIVELLAHAGGELELDRQLVRIAPAYPGIKDPVAAQAALRKMVGRRRAELFPSPSLRRQSAAEPTGPIAVSALGELNSAERTLFRALLSEEFRTSAWIICRVPAMFATGLGERISRSVAEAFADAEPEGQAREWLHRLQPEELQDYLMALLDDPVSDRLNNAFVSDAINKLRTLREDRLQRQMREAATDDEAKQRYLVEVLKRRKPDVREISADPEDSF